MSAVGDIVVKVADLSVEQYECAANAGRCLYLIVFRQIGSKSRTIRKHGPAKIKVICEQLQQTRTYTVVIYCQLTKVTGEQQL